MRKCTTRSTQSLTVADLSRLQRSYNKYRAVRTNGFASKKEANRYQELMLLQRAGKVSDLSTQVKFPLSFEGIHICNYIADFTYDDDQGNVIVEDCKGMRTREYKLKARLMQAIYRIKIFES
jgi:hypothetical protein